MSTGIQWTDETWNPVTGCTKISPGCANCYAETLTRRFPGTWHNGFDVRLYPDRLDKPRHWKKPRRVFVNSMSDIFHQDVPLEFIVKIFKTIEECPQHTFQILTKRAGRMDKLKSFLPWPDNLWIGVSIESQAQTRRLLLLNSVPAAVRFVSAEPLIGPLTLDLEKVDWLIVGGESGTSSRPLELQWATSLRDQAIASEVPFFFKQWGGRSPKKAGRLLEGHEWSEFPAGRSTVVS